MEDLKGLVGALSRLTSTDDIGKQALREIGWQPNVRNKKRKRRARRKKRARRGRGPEVLITQRAGNSIVMSNSDTNVKTLSGGRVSVQCTTSFSLTSGSNEQVMVCVPGNPLMHGKGPMWNTAVDFAEYKIEGIEANWVPNDPTAVGNMVMGCYMNDCVVPSGAFGDAIADMGGAQATVGTPHKWRFNTINYPTNWEQTKNPRSEYSFYLVSDSPSTTQGKLALTMHYTFRKRVPSDSGKFTNLGMGTCNITSCTIDTSTYTDFAGLNIGSALVSLDYKVGGDYSTSVGDIWRVVMKATNQITVELMRTGIVIPDSTFTSTNVDFMIFSWTKV